MEILIGQKLQEVLFTLLFSMFIFDFLHKQRPHSLLQDVFWRFTTCEMDFSKNSGFFSLHLISPTPKFMNWTQKVAVSYLQLRLAPKFQNKFIFHGLNEKKIYLMKVSDTNFVGISHFKGFITGLHKPIKAINIYFSWCSDKSF